jgi:cysteinyl-tRNA synthetase
MKMPLLELFNTESRSKEAITSRDGKKIRLYTCGPTVYNFAHIGNFRTYVFEDLLRRTLKFFGFEVTQVMNITDIDDKTLKGAMEAGIPLRQFTDPFTEAFFADLDVLHIERAEVYPRATDYIPKMVELIEALLKEGIAYRSPDGSVYYSIRTFPTYGRLSHLDLGACKEGAAEEGIVHDEYDKEHAADFVLWKAYDAKRDGAIFWDSSLGAGRPGWHIECSAMAMTLLGTTIDIHVGGVDNLFPHHENEIAQSEGVTKQKFVRYWLHSEHLLVDHKKMSKSLGNFYTLRDLLEKGFSGRTVRYLLLQSHYRMQLNFTLEGLKAAARSLERIDDFLFRLRGVSDSAAHGIVKPLMDHAHEGFVDSLADDLNISAALAAIFDLIREVNFLMDQQRIGKGEVEELLGQFSVWDRVLGVIHWGAPKEATLTRELEWLLAEREEARRRKDWKAADAVRNLLLEKGYIIEDTPTGARLKKR